MRIAHSPLILAALISLGCGGSPAATEPSTLAGAGSSASGASGHVGGGGGATPGNTSGGSSELLGSGVSGSGGASGSAGTGGASVDAAGASGSSWMIAFATPPAGCAVCHGSTGAGQSGLGPDIQHPTRELFDYLVRHGEPNRLAKYAAPMPAVGDALVSDTDLNAIFDWLGA